MQSILLHNFGDKIGLNLKKRSGFGRIYSDFLGSLYEMAAELFCIKRVLDVIFKEKGINTSA